MTQVLFYNDLVTTKDLLDRMDLHSAQCLEFTFISELPQHLRLISNLKYKCCSVKEMKQIMTTIRQPSIHYMFLLCFQIYFKFNGWFVDSTLEATLKVIINSFQCLRILNTNIGVIYFISLIKTRTTM